jgi:hypothetical protein
MTAFHASTNALVSDLQVTHGRLMVGGSFSNIDGHPIKGLATVTTDTGEFDPYLDLDIEGQVSSDSGPTRVYRYAISPNGTEGVAIGNFTSVDQVPHSGAFRFRLGYGKPSLVDWDDPDLHAICGPTANMPVWSRDVQFSPNGKFFVIDGTGGAKTHGNLCDTAARWETSSRGSDSQPTWINHTCADTLQSVAVTNHIVYVQGHQKCVAAKNGHEVPRYGIAALNADTGYAMHWRSDQSRLVGGKYLMVTNAAKQAGFPSGLWSGCDCHAEGGVIFRPWPNTG